MREAKCGRGCLIYQRLETSAFDKSKRVDGERGVLPLPCLAYSTTTRLASVNALISYFDSSVLCHLPFAFWQNNILQRRPRLSYPSTYTHLSNNRARSTPWTCLPSLWRELESLEVGFIKCHCFLSKSLHSIETAN